MCVTQQTSPKNSDRAQPPAHLSRCAVMSDSSRPRRRSSSFSADRSCSSTASCGLVCHPSVAYCIAFSVIFVVFCHLHCPVLELLITSHAPTHLLPQQVVHHRAVLAQGLLLKEQQPAFGWLID